MNYKVEIKNERFDKNSFKRMIFGENSKILPREKTALVTFFNDDGEVEQVNKYGYIEAKEIYQLIKEGKYINVNYTYVNSFSIIEYKKMCKLHVQTYIDIKGISAICSFFDSETNFSYTNFGEGKLDFRFANFGNGNIDFRFANFGDDNVYFNYSKFGAGEVDFSFTNLGYGNIEFSEVSAENSHIIFKNCVFQGYSDMRFKKCNKLEILNCKIEKNLDMNWSEEIPVSINTLNILNTDVLSHIKLDWKKNKVKKMIKLQKKQTSYYEKAKQLRILKENFRNLGQYDDEDNAYVEFKRYEIMSKLKGENIEDKFKRYISIFWNGLWFLPKKLLLDWIGGFGTKPFNVFTTMLITITYFASLYLYSPIMEISFKDSEISNEFIKAIYYSAITFLTIGYGDIKPMNEITAISSIIEGFIGVFLMSYFTVAFVRKILR